MGINFNRRITWIDTAKGIGIILVIFGHIGFGRFETWLYSFHMPLFFFLSGYVYKAKDSYDVFLLKKVRTILIPYIVFVILFIFYDFQGKDLGEYFLSMLIQKRYYHLWFLACLFLLENLYYPVVMFTRDNDLIIAVITLLFVLIWLMAGKKILVWNVDAVLYSAPYFAVGYILKKHSLPDFSLKRLVILSPIFLLLNIIFIVISLRLSGGRLEMFTGEYGSFIFTYIAAFFGIAFTVCMSIIFDNRALRYIGKNSIVYFGIHPLISLPVAKSILITLNCHDSPGLLGTAYKLAYAALTIVVTTVISYIYNLIKNTARKNKK